MYGTRVRVSHNRIPIIMLMDSAALFDVITRHRSTASGRLMLDFHAARRPYLCGEIDNLGLIESRYNVADSHKNQKPELIPACAFAYLQDQPSHQAVHGITFVIEIAWSCSPLHAFFSVWGVF
jgi:hypothetical protein